MKLHHIAFWTENIEIMEEFYVKHFNGKTIFSHQDGDFSSKFLRICDGINLELMNRSEIPDSENNEPVGYSHLSLECESKEEVDRLTDYFKLNGVPLDKDKVQYDDGFYESSVRDPDGNIIELAYIDRSVSPSV